MSKPLDPISQLDRARRWFLLATRESSPEARRACYLKGLKHCNALWAMPALAFAHQLALLEIVHHLVLSLHMDAELCADADTNLMAHYQRLCEDPEHGPLIAVLRAQHLSLRALQQVDQAQRLHLLRAAEQDFLMALERGEDPLLHIALSYTQWAQVPLLSPGHKFLAAARLLQRLTQLFQNTPYRLVMEAPLVQLLDELTTTLVPEQAVGLLVAVHQNQLLAHHPEAQPRYGQRFVLLEQPLVTRLAPDSEAYQQLIDGFLTNCSQLSPFVIWREPRIIEWLELFRQVGPICYDHPRYLHALQQFEHYVLQMLYLPERPREPVWMIWSQSVNAILALAPWELRAAYLTPMAEKMRGLLHDQLLTPEAFQTGWLRLLWLHLFSYFWEPEYISFVLDLLLEGYRELFTPQEELHPCLTCEHPMIFQVLAAAEGPIYRLVLNFVNRWHQLVLDIHYCNWNLKGWAMLLHDLAMHRNVHEARELLELACVKYEAARELDEEDAELFTLWGECLQDRAACHPDAEATTFRAQADEKYRRALELIYRAS
jgi:hypothetical protein